MGSTVKAIFPSRREVELAVEHLVQEYGIARTDIFIEPAGDANSSGDVASGADSASGDDREPRGAAYAGPLVVSVDLNSDELGDVKAAFRDAGATDVLTA